jgi:hypothetical protein
MEDKKREEIKKNMPRNGEQEIAKKLGCSYKTVNAVMNGYFNNTIILLMAEKLANGEKKRKKQAQKDMENIMKKV